jgi:hypothetical protein
VLFLLQNLALVDEAVVLGAALFVRHEGVDSSPNGLHIRLVENGLAEFPGLLHHGRFFNGRWHIQ